jgi:high affinity Mn2+ porin
MLRGGAWGRAADTIGIGAALNDISTAARAYFAAGGIGILIGDGQLPHPGAERIFETFYSILVIERLVVGVDYQYIANPAYNRDRGPVSIFGLRAHAEF